MKLEKRLQKAVTGAREKEEEDSLLVLLQLASTEKPWPGLPEGMLTKTEEERIEEEGAKTEVGGAKIEVGGDKIEVEGAKIEGEEVKI